VGWPAPTLRGASDRADTPFKPPLGTPDGSPFCLSRGSPRGHNRGHLLAGCEEGCRDPSAERMSFVDAHQVVFVSHGVCARAADDPSFDRECFSGNGETFESSLTKAATK
jgi:hypothetical protein